MNNSIYLRRQGKVWVEAGAGHQAPSVIVALLKNLEPLGYTLRPALIERLQTLSLDGLTDFYGALVADLRALTGADKKWAPMYPNFPRQVVEAGEAELYLNAIIHYWTLALPEYEKKERLPLLDITALKAIDLGSVEDFEAIFTRLAASKTSLSQADKDDAAWFVLQYGEQIYRLLPPEMPLKENVAFLGAALLRSAPEGALKYLQGIVKGATDVLRLAVALSEGDVSLAAPTKFGKITRGQRRLLLGLLEGCPNIAEDMLRWKGRWLRLGERLHPGEFGKRFPNCNAAFDILRNDKPLSTFGREVEKAVASRDSLALLELLAQRPGDFARRLDHLLRLDAKRPVSILERVGSWALRADVSPERNHAAIVARFSEVASRVSTPVLLQVAAHFNHRSSGRGLRTFFPKGSVAKVQAIENTLPELPMELCLAVVGVCEGALQKRFAALEPLGKCWIDPRLRHFPIAFAQRSASKSLRTLARGSRLELPEGDTLRFFVWWKDGKNRTDLDLSAVLYDADYKYLGVLSYYNLKGFGGHHSGDITSAPEGAAEFIDVSLARLREGGVRYVVASVNSYTEQPFCDLPECFAGWMARQEPDSGEVFEPRTLQDRIDIASDTQICLPLVIDIHEKQALWTDIALRREPSWNNVANNLGGVSLMLRAMTTLAKPNLFDLFSLHAGARGELVSTREEAEQVFALHEGLTPFEADTIASQWL